jgi:hypothetical protein
MPHAKTANQAETSLRLLDEAEQHRENDDLYKACEKGLEAVHSYLRTVGEERDWARETKRDLYDISLDLEFETDDPKEAGLYHRASEGGFAIKFWGSHHTWRQVETGIRSARKWLSMMENRSKPPQEIRESQLSREREARRRVETRKKLKEMRERRGGRSRMDSLDRLNGGG